MMMFILDEETALAQRTEDGDVEGTMGVLDPETGTTSVQPPASCSVLMLVIATQTASSQTTPPRQRAIARNLDPSPASTRSLEGAPVAHVPGVPA